MLSLHDWFQTSAGQYLLSWEQTRLDESVVDIFGYHALQLGLPELDALRSNRMSHRWLAVPTGEDLRQPGGARSELVVDPTGLPFAESSLDLVVLPHTLETSLDPHATLREVERVLVPEGRVVICCFNPTSLWGARQRRERLYERLGLGQPYLPTGGEFMGYLRLRDWLRLLSFEVESAHFGCYRPAVTSGKWLARYEWMDRLGERWWPIFGAAYCVVAVKRVRGMRLLGPAWRVPRRSAAVSVSAANCQAPAPQIELRVPFSPKI